MTKCEKILVGRKNFRTRRGMTARYQTEEFLKSFRKANKREDNPFVACLSDDKGGFLSVFCPTLRGAKILALGAILRGEYDNAVVKAYALNLEIWSR